MGKKIFLFKQWMTSKWLAVKAKWQMLCAPFHSWVHLKIFDDENNAEKAQRFVVKFNHFT